MNEIMNFSNPKDALEWATIISKTKGFCPKEYWDRPHEILCAIQYGHELGVTPMQSIQGVAVINGKPSVYGDLLLAICKASQHFEYCNETFDAVTLTATCIAKRKGQPEVIRTFDKQKAINAQLWGQLNYKKYPERMLQMRARSFALRDCFPDVLKGMIAVEEAQDYTNAKEAHTEVKAIEQIPTEVKIIEQMPTHDPELYALMMTTIYKHNVPNELIEKWKKHARVYHMKDLSAEQMQSIINYLQKEIEVEENNVEI